MADNTTDGTQDQQVQSTFSMKEVSDALRTNTEATTMLANAIVQSMDEDTKNRVMDINTRPGFTQGDRRYETRSVMVDHINKLAKASKDAPILHKINGSLSKLLITMDSLHAGIISLTKHIDAAAGATKSATQEEVKKAPRGRKKREEAEEAAIKRIEQSRSQNTRDFNKYIRMNPFMRTMMPKTTALGKKFAAYGDALANAGLPGGGMLGKLGKGIAMGGPWAVAIGLGVQLAASIAKRFMASGASAYAMEGLTGGNYSWKYQEYYRSRAGRYGLSGDEAFRKQQDYAKHGIKTADEVLSGIRAEKYFGVSNMAQYFQNLKRTTTDVNKFGSDLGKSLFRLQGIVHRTSMGMDEMVQHQTGFIDQFKGATTAFDTDQVVSIFSRFSKLLNSKEISGAELGNIYSLGQRVNFNTLLTTAKFAEMGGYNFGGAQSLLSKAYRIRRMGSGDLVNRAELMRAALQGIYQVRGATKYRNLDDEGKAIVSEQLIPQILGAEVSKFPNLEEVMDALDAGSKTTEAGEDVLTSIEKAKKVDLDAIVSSMDALIQPVNHIKEFLFASVEGLAAQKAYRDKSYKEDHRDEILSKQANANILVTNASSYDLTFTNNTPGDAATVYSGPNPTKVGTNR